MIQDCKIKVTPEESRIVQQIAFEHGYEWGINKKQICHTESSYLFIDNSDMSITYSSNNSREFFENAEEPQISFQEFIEKYVTSTIKNELNDQTMNEEKKIIGYRPKPDAPIEAINAIACTNVNHTYNDDVGFYYKIIENSFSVENFRKHGVLDLWFDPVYEDDHKPTKHITLGDHGNRYDFYVYSPKSVDVYKNGEYVITVTLKKVRMLLKHLENQIKIHGFHFNIDNDAIVGFGCVKMTFENLVYAIDNILDGEDLMSLTYE